MANSFSIKVGADTKDFNKSLRDADNQIRTTTRLGDALTKTLEHKYDATTAEQAQKQFQKALTDTQDKAEALRKQMEHMEKAGQIDSNQYRKLETDLAKATLEAANLENKLEEVSRAKVEELAKNFEKVGSAIECGKEACTVFRDGGGCACWRCEVIQGRSRGWGQHRHNGIAIRYVDRSDTEVAVCRHADGCGKRDAFEVNPKNTGGVWRTSNGREHCGGQST